MEDHRRLPKGEVIAQLPLLPPSAGLQQVSVHWRLTKDGDRHCLEISRRHYSARRYLIERQPLFVGPGRKMVLLSNAAKALWVWREFKDDCQPPQSGINCAVFRNEGEPGVTSSQLIVEASEAAWLLWGRKRLYTLVNAARIRSTNPGYCFQMAGWHKCGRSKNGKVILEMIP